MLTWTGIAASPRGAAEIYPSLFLHGDWRKEEGDAEGEEEGDTVRVRKCDSKEDIEGPTVGDREEGMWAFSLLLGSSRSFCSFACLRPFGSGWSFQTSSIVGKQCPSICRQYFLSTGSMKSHWAPSHPVSISHHEITNGSISSTLPPSWIGPQNEVKN